MVKRVGHTFYRDFAANHVRIAINFSRGCKPRIAELPGVAGGIFMDVSYLLQQKGAVVWEHVPPDQHWNLTKTSWSVRSAMRKFGSKKEELARNEGYLTISYNFYMVSCQLRSNTDWIHQSRVMVTILPTIFKRLESHLGTDFSSVFSTGLGILGSGK